MSYKTKINSLNVVLSRSGDDGLVFTLRKSIDYSIDNNLEFCLLSSSTESIAKGATFKALGVDENGIGPVCNHATISEFIKRGKWCSNFDLSILSSKPSNLLAELEELLISKIGEFTNKVIVVDISGDHYIPSIITKVTFSNLAKKHNAKIFLHSRFNRGLSLFEIQHLKSFSIIRKKKDEDIYQEKSISL